MPTAEERLAAVEELATQALEIARRHASEHADEGSDPFTGTGTTGHTHDTITDADLDTAWEAEQSADEDKLRGKTGGTERLVLDSAALELSTVPLQFEEISQPSTPALDHSRLYVRSIGGSIVSLIWKTSDGVEQVIASGFDFATPHTNTLTLNWIE